MCFTITPRSTSRFTGAAIAFPETLANVATAGGESPITAGQLASFGSAPAPLTVTPGTPQLAAAKSAAPKTVPPGVPVDYTLTTTNTGTAAIPGLTITEPLPASLVFDTSFVGTGGQPYTITSTVPTAAPPVPSPTFTVTNTPAGTTLVWQFPESYQFDPASTVTLGFEATLQPGTPGGTVVNNTYGAGTVDGPTKAALTCKGGSHLIRPWAAPHRRASRPAPAAR